MKPKVKKSIMLQAKKLSLEKQIQESLSIQQLLKYLLTFTSMRSLKYYTEVNFNARS